MRRENLIQIRFNDISLVWDLSQNKQIKDLIFPYHFSTPQTFTSVGLSLNASDKKDQSKNPIIIENQE